MKGRTRESYETLREEALRRYRAGERAPALAAALRINLKTLRGWAKAAGILRDERALTGKPAAVKEAALRQLAAGEAALGIAAELGVSTSTIYAWARETGTRPGRPMRYDEAVRAKAALALAAGSPPKAVAADLGISPSIVYIWKRTGQLPAVEASR